MLFSRDIYKIGARCPYLFGRKEQKEAGTLFYTALFANATDIVNLPVVSPLHAIMARPTVNENIFNAVTEIPRGAKDLSTVLDLATPHNPFNIGGATTGNNKSTAATAPFNYGFIPRTYSSPTVPDASFALHLKSAASAAGGKKGSSASAAVGDGGALDVIDLTPSSLVTGMASQIRVLGAFAVTSAAAGPRTVVDWKIIAANIDDDRFEAGLKAVPEAQLKEIKEWLLRHDKSHSSNNKNNSYASSAAKKTIAFGGLVLDEAAAVAVVEAHRAAYDALRAAKASAAPKGFWVPDAKSNPALQV